MAKEIGNWGKTTRPASGQNAAADRSTSAALVIGPRLDDGEILLWASYGSGTRRISLLIWLAVFQLSIIAAGLAALVAPPLTETLGYVGLLVVWLVILGPPAYAICSLRFGPQMEVYAVTNKRAVILRQYFPFVLKTCKILRLRVDEEKFGSVLFGKEEYERSGRFGGAIGMTFDARPDPGFYGVAKPRDVAHLISKHVAPDVFVDTHAKLVDELNARKTGRLI